MSKGRKTNTKGVKMIELKEQNEYTINAQFYSDVDAQRFWNHNAQRRSQLWRCLGVKVNNQCIKPKIKSGFVDYLTNQISSQIRKGLK
jgi:hypothetical protein